MLHCEVCSTKTPNSKRNKCLYPYCPGGSARKWTQWDLNPGPSACEADVMPLHHVPVMFAVPLANARVLHGDVEASFSVAVQTCSMCALLLITRTCISGLVVEYIVAIDVTRLRFPADAFFLAGKYLRCQLPKHVFEFDLEPRSIILIVASRGNLCDMG
jgi:hypothetical protein